MKNVIAFTVLSTILLTACEQSGVPNLSQRSFNISYENVKAVCESTDDTSIRGSECVEGLANLNEINKGSDPRLKNLVDDLTTATYLRMTKSEVGVYNADGSLKQAQKTL
tara:strand:+ start:84651 stop:84980 length:330 start_codon:yes stop_codon:yes gene_type:complete